MQFRLAHRLGYAHPDQMLAGLSSRQLTEIYAFLEVEPLDDPLQVMIAQLTDVLAKVNGNETSPSDFLLVRKPATPDSQLKRDGEDLINMFLRASKANAAV